MTDTPRALLEFGPSLRRILAAVALAFAILVALSVHGFSLSFWHRIIDQSPATEVLLGEARGVRWDDWAVQLPLALAQSAHDPAFPVVNRNVGLGQNMLLPISLPVAHALTLFRPTCWGFFLGNDTGLAWMWWSQVLGLFAVWLLVFLVVTRGMLALSVGGSLVLCFSPAFQFFSFNPAPMTIFMGLSFLAAAALLSARRPVSIVASGLALGWSACAFALAIYPPFQVALGFLLAVLVAGFVWDRRRELDVRSALPLRLAGAALALLVVGLGFALLFREASAEIAIMASTVYPGDRVSTGGDFPLWTALSSNFWTPLQLGHYGSLRGINKAASFWLLSPVIGAGLLWRSAARREELDLLALGLLLFCALLFFYCHVGFPEALARGSLFSMMPARRAMLGLGVADTLLLLRFLSRRADAVRSGPGRPASARSSLLLAALWSLLLAYCALLLHRASPETGWVWLVALTLANGVLAFLVLERRHPAAVVFALAAVLVASTIWFNPVAVGGSDYLTRNPLSQKIVEIDRAHAGRSVWATYGPGGLPNLFRAIGVRAIDGVHPIPQLALWERLAPSPDAVDIYNRYASVSLALPRPDDHKILIRTLREDALQLRIHPQDRAFRRLGVTHVLVQMGSGFERGFSEFEPVARVGKNWLFEIPPGPGGGRSGRSGGG